MNRVIVAAAVVERDGRFLVTRRPPGVHLEGFWEFPGGKCDAGETLPVCLMREMREELGVDTRVGDELLNTTHDYPDRRVQLHFLRCEVLGEPVPMAGQQMVWVTRAQLTTLSFPPADLDLIKLLVG
jgi:mutator protein MutT